MTYGQIRRLSLIIVFMVLGAIALVWLAARVSEVLTLLAVSALLATALRPTVERIGRARVPGLKRDLPRPAAILVIYLGLLLAIAGILVLVIPQMIREARNLAASAPEYARQADASLDQLRLTYPWVPELEALQDQLARQLAGGASQLVDVLLFAVNLLTGLFSVLLVLVLTFLLLMEGDRLFDHLVYLLPEEHQETARVLGAKASRKVEGWLRGVLLLSTFIGVTTAVGMTLIGMPYPLLLGLAAGVFELVPMVGAALGAAPAVIVALFQPTWQLVAVIVFFVVLQQAENNLLVPAIMGSQLDISPLLTIVALLIGGALTGIVGALMAVPVAAILQVIWLDVVVPWVKSQQHGPPT